jgi:hypothetical protein
MITVTCPKLISAVISQWTGKTREEILGPLLTHLVGKPLIATQSARTEVLQVFYHQCAPQPWSHITARRRLFILLQSENPSPPELFLDGEGSNKIAEGSHFGTARFLG